MTTGSRFVPKITQVAVLLEKNRPGKVQYWVEYSTVYSTQKVKAYKMNKQ